MKKALSILLATIMLFTSIGLNSNMVEVSASNKGRNNFYKENISTPSSIRVLGASDDITFTAGGTKTQRTVDVTVNTKGKEVAGITYERGYNKTATPKSKRIYGHEEKVGTFTFSLDNVYRYVSVMVILKDSDTGNVSTIYNNYELKGERVYNSGSGTFSLFPKNPLNDDTNMETLYSDKMDDMSGGDNGPLVIADDEVWIFTNYGGFQVYSMDDIDEYFNTSIDINPVFTGSLGRYFDEISASAVFDGRYIIVKDNYGYLAFVEASTRKVVTSYTTVNEGIISGYKNNNRLYGNICALTFDHNTLYLLGRYGSTGYLYKATRNEITGGYVVDSTELTTFTNGVYGSSSHGNDMIFDGENIWIARNQNSILKYNISTNTTTTHPLTDGYVSRLVYDGNDYIYAISTQALYANTDLARFKKSDGSYTKVYTDMIPADGNKEDITYDGRNIWVNTYSVAEANRYRYDTKTGKNVEIPSNRWQIKDNNYNETQNNAIGVYDGKYLWHWQYTQGRVNVIGHLIDLYFGTEAKNSNLEKYFSSSPSLDPSTAVYVDDKDTTLPNYVDIKLKDKGYSTSDIVYAAWTLDEDMNTAKTRDSEFFADLGNYVDDDTIKDDWDGYAGKTGSYFSFDKADLPTVNGDGSFNFSFKTYPKKNGYYTLYMVNEEYRPYIETVYVDNYQQMARLYINFIDDVNGETVLQNMDESNAAGSKVTVKADKFLSDLEEMGYQLKDANSKDITLNSESQEINFTVTKYKKKWTEVIKKPYYLDGAGTKKYIGDEISTGNYLLVSKEGTPEADQYTAVIDAPHMENYALVDPTEATKTVKLPSTNGGTLENFGRTVVEFEYVLSESNILTTGIEVDGDTKPTGNLVYTELVPGGETESKSISAKNDLENWELVGLVNYDDQGVFSNVSVGANSKDIIFGTDKEVTFAYKRKTKEVKVTYVDKVGAEIGTSDTFNLPINTEEIFVAKHIDGYKLVSTYLDSEMVTDSLNTISFTYEPIKDAIKINARLESEIGKILAGDSVDADLGAINVSVSASNLENMLSPRYILDTTSPRVVSKVGENTVVDFVFKEKKTKVTVNYLDLTDNSLATKKEYEVFYGDLISEDAKSIKNYFFDSASGNATEASYHQVANSDTVTLNFIYKPANGAISVLAKDSITGAILGYKVENGVPGESLTIDSPDTYFERESFLTNYTLKADTTLPASVTFDINHQELVFLYDSVKYTVTLTAKDEEDADINFFDGASSKVFTYKKGSNYSIYAPPVTGYEVISDPPFLSGSNINANVTHTFKYKKIDRTVNLSIKAISDDETIIINTGVISGDRGIEKQINVSDYYAYIDLDKWELVDVASKKAIFGTDKEVKFKFKRKMVDLTVKYVNSSGAEIADSEIISVPTKSNYNVNAKFINNYEYATDQQPYEVIAVGTSNLTVEINYVSASGNILVVAKDKETGEILEGKYYSGNIGDTYTAMPSDLKTNSSAAYKYDEASETSLTVTATPADNIVNLYYTKVMSDIIVKYVDEGGIDIIPPKTYKAQFDQPVEEYAINVDFHNLTSVNHQEISKVSESPHTITFTYERVNYEIVTDGVINIIAKGTDGNTLALKSISGTIGEQQIVNATAIFGDVVGYKLKDNEEKSAVYTNGFVNIEFLYEPTSLNVTIVAKDKDGKNLPITDNIVPIKEGDSIMINAPHIENYSVIGIDKDDQNSDDFINYTNVMSAETATFYYEPIGKLVVSKGIEVDSSGKATGNTVYSQIHNGNESTTTKINAKTNLPNWTLVGLYTADGDISKDITSKDVVYGIDEEVTFAYTRKMIDITVNYVEDGTGLVLGTDVFNVPLNDKLTITAKVVDGYELKDKNADSYKKTITANDSSKTQSFTYIKLQEGVVIEARLDSPTGKVLVRSSTDYPIGDKNVKVTADDLNAMLSPRYVLEPSSQSPYTLSLVEKDSVVVFIYKEQLSTVTINYVDSANESISAQKTYTVPYGTAISESAKSVDDYYLDTSKSSALYNVEGASQSSYNHTFYYKIAGGSITVMAKDKDTQDILYYKVYTADQGSTLTINASEEFSAENFIGYYSLSGDNIQTMPYGNKHKEIVFLYERDTYTVTIKAEDLDGNPLSFYDGETSKVFTYNKGGKYLIYAPPVVGYEIKAPYVAENNAEGTGIVANTEFTFVYENIDMDENLVIKGISDDGKYIIGSKVLTGQRKELASVIISNYENEIYNPDDWTLVGDGVQEAIFGNDKEVVFTFKRNKVKLTVNHIKETASGDVIESTSTVDVNTNSKFTSSAMLIDDYQLKSSETFRKVTEVGTTDIAVEYRYIPIEGNVFLHAVDSKGNTLLVRGVEATTNSPYTVTQDKINEISSALAPGYLYDLTSTTTLDNVSSDLSKNIIELKYKDVDSVITVKYVDQFGVEVFPTSTYTMQYGEAFNEYAVNIDYYNLTSTKSSYSETVSEPEYNIVFEYQLVDYTIVTDGVVNIIAKVSDGKGGYKILDFKSKNGTIGETVRIGAAEELGEFTGYKLKDEPYKEATFVSGYVEVVFLYEMSNLAITIVAKDKTTNEVLNFTEESVIPVIEGGTVTVHAPHIAEYEVDGLSYKTFENVTNSQEYIFYFNKIAVPSTLNIKHISYVNGYQVVVKTEVLKGNVGEVITISPIKPSEALEMGYEINENYNLNKKLTYGIDSGFTFLYNRIMSKLNINHNVEIYDKDNTTLLSTMSETEKASLAPNLLNSEYTVSNGEFTTVIAPFENNYVINTNKNTEKLRQIIKVEHNQTVNYYYRNITGNVLIRAVVEDKDGTEVINGKKYTLLAQLDDAVDAGGKYTSAEANKVKGELEGLISPPYIYSGLISGSEDFTMGSGDTYEDHTITYEFTADYKDVEISYFDKSGVLLSPNLLGIKFNPVKGRIIKGEYFSEYALNVQNYNFMSSSINGQNSQKVYYNEVVNDDTKVGFYYEPVTLVQPTVPTTINMTYNGTSIGNTSVDVYPGQVVFAPYRDGYKPTNESITIGTEVEATYEFKYSKVEKEIEKEVIHVNTDRTKTVYVDVPRGVDYSGTAYEHEKYVNGYPDGSVKPDFEITRAEVVVMLYNILYDEKTDKNIYAATTLRDIDQDKWYAEAVNYMTIKRYVNGYEDETFKPDKNITRAELATILSNVFGTVNNSEVNALPLDPNNWATPFIIKAYSNGLYNGFSLNDYDFNALATRAEVIVMINNGTNRIPNRKYLSQFEIPNDLNQAHWAYYHILESLNSHKGHYEGNFGDEYEIVE
ncbi:MAG: MucBP domain-containing protein [Lachnospirales bacterium]